MGVLALLVVINNNGDSKCMQIYTLFKAVSLELKGARGLDKCFDISFSKVGMSETKSLSPLCGMMWFTLFKLID